MSQTNSFTDGMTTNSSENLNMNSPIASTPKFTENHVSSKDYSYEKGKGSENIYQKPVVKSSTLRSTTQQRQKVKEQVGKRQKGRRK